MRILLVEDDKELCDAIKLQLERAGYETDCCGQGQEAFYYASEYPYDVIILDRMLPQMDGLGVLGGLRRMNITIPVIITTALDGINDRIDGLDAGADDYLVKPFALEELHARIRALLRRHNNQGESELIVGNLTLNMGRRQVWMGGEELILTPKEYALLSRLMLKAGSPVHREILYNDIYNWDNEPSTNTLEVHIHNLRDKVGKARIRTVRGFGYMLVANEEN